MFHEEGVMRFGYTIVYVADVLGTIAFYERAFGLARSFVSDETYGELATGATTLSFAADTLAGSFISGGYRRNDPAEQPAGIEIGLVTDDVNAAWDKALAAGAAAVSPPVVKPWGQTVAYVRDCNGVLVELCTPMG